MDFSLSEQHKMLKETVRNFMTKEIEPIAEEIDRENRMPEWIWDKLGKLGLLCIAVPEEYGGGGFDCLAELLCGEEMSRICPAIAQACIMTHSSTAVGTLYRNSSEEQRRKYLPALCRGEKIGAFCLSEPEAGSDATALRMTAKKDGDSYILNGTKIFITNGSIADVFVVFAKTNLDAGAKGISAFIVEKDMPGSLETTKYIKMGCRGADNAQVFFDDYRIPAENILGGEGMGMKVMLSGLDMDRTVSCGMALGIAQRCLELSIQYANERVQFGQTIGNFQLIQKKIADMYSSLEAARLLAYKAAILAEEGSPEAHNVSAAAVYISDQVGQKSAWEAVQIHGGTGYMLEHASNRLFRDARLMSIGAGTSEIRIITIARELLKKGV